MIRTQLLFFILRWVASVFGMWICITLFGTITTSHQTWLFILAGLIFSLVNAFVKPLVTVLALPLLIITLGFVTVLINIAMVALTIWLLPGAKMDFWGALASALVMSLINTLVNLLIPSYNKREYGS